MRVATTLPKHAVNGACIDGRQPKNGERVVDLRVNVEQFYPAEGTLCVRESMVRNMMKQLDIVEQTADVQTELDFLHEQVEALGVKADLWDQLGKALAEHWATADV